jgi:nitrate reductase NapE component
VETFVIVFWLVCAVVAAFIAYRKKRRVETWFFLGLFFGIFALIAVALVRSKSSLTWRCPICGAMNQEMSFFCYSCNTKRTDIPL